MRIGILSFHDADNFGCVLQCFSLQEIIKEIIPDAEVEIINYTRAGEPKRLSDCGEGIEKERIIREDKFERFRYEYMNIVGGPVWDTDKLDPDRYDCCVVGSDQVWNDVLVRGHEKVYFLDFAGKHTKRISYAASLGGVTGSQERMSWLLEWIKKLDSVSLRESCEYEVLTKKTGMPITVCIDPTLLHDKQYWMKYEKKPKKFGDEKYILLYSLGYGYCRDSEYKAAQMTRKVAKANNLKILHYYYGTKKEWLPIEAENYYCEGPQELLWLFHHAEYVICCSFHGTAFSIIYERPFYTFHVPGNGNRMKDLVDNAGIPERYVDEIPDEHNWDWNIPWDRVNKAIEEKRDYSIAYLKKELEING